MAAPAPAPVPVPAPEPVAAPKKKKEPRYKIQHADLHNPHIEKYEHHHHDAPSAAAALVDNAFGVGIGTLMGCYGIAMVLEARHKGKH